MTTIGIWLISVIRRPCVWIPALLLAAATVVFWTTDLDIALVRPFFSGKSADHLLAERWPLMVAQPWRAIYRLGVVPAWILGVSGLFVWIIGVFWTKLKAWRRQGLYCALVLIFGPGILINCVLKPGWNRPRPHATTAFGGDRAFVPVWQWGYKEQDSSFPSGHAAMGFYLMTPAFLCWPRRRWLAAGFLLLGIIAGCTIGLTRVVAGGHFPSDILWSGGIVYFTALALAAWLRPWEADAE